MNDWRIAFSPCLINIFFSFAIFRCARKSIYVYILVSVWEFLGDDAACGPTVAITTLY